MSLQTLSGLIPNTGIYLQLASFAVVLLVGLLVTQTVLLRLVSFLLRRRGARPETRHSVRNLTKFVGFFMSFTIALQAGNFGNLVTVIGAIAAASTVAIGFGMRDQISNIIAGFFIFLKNPFYVGDYIKTENTEGVVEDITILYTSLTGSASQTIHVPNSQLTMEEVKNYTKETNTKASISVRLPNEHLQEGMELLESTVCEHAEVLADPEPEVVYLDADGEVIAEVQYWLDDSWASKRVKSEILEVYNQRAVDAALFGHDERGERASSND